MVRPAALADPCRRLNADFRKIASPGRIVVVGYSEGTSDRQTDLPVSGCSRNPDAAARARESHILRRKRVARRDYFLERNQRDLGCPVPSEKIFWFSEEEISARFAAVLSHQSGVGQPHGRGAGCGGRGWCF